MLIIEDNFFSPEEFNELRETYATQSSMTSIWLPAEQLDGVLKKLLTFAKTKFRIGSLGGVEVWTHNNTKPGVHVDKDEGLFNCSGQERFPLCSIVVYLTVNNVNGGVFECPGVSVAPIANRVLFFSPGLVHNVTDYTGDRCCLAVNPWDYPPKDLHAT